MILRLLVILIIAWCLLRAGLLTLAWNGNPDPAAQTRVLQHFTSEDIQKGRDYAHQGFWAKVSFGYVQVALFLLLILTGFSGKMFDRITAWWGGATPDAGVGFWLPSLLFLLAFFFLLQLIALPFQFYLGYWCEKAAGFSTMTVDQWFWTFLKKTAIGMALQIPIILSLIWVLRSFPRFWPFLIPLLTAGFSIVMTLLFPILITPLFYEQKPLAEGPLRTRILEIAATSKVPVEDIYEIDESRYSKHTNAYFTGLFSKKRIVLYDTLVKSHTVEEAALIFAHEVGHWLHDHVRIGLTLAFLGTLGGCLAAWWLFPFLRAEPALYLREIWHPVNLPFAMLLGTLLTLFFAPVEAQISQHFERQADRASLELTGNTKVFIDAEVRLARDNHSELLPHPFRVFWLYSHPPAIDRVQMALDNKPPTTPEPGK